MIEKDGYRRNNHSVTSLKAQIVLTTKYRENILKFNIKKSLGEILIQVCKKYDIDLLGFAIEPQHVHIAIEYHPRLSISRIVNLIKGITSHELRAKYGILEDFCEDAFWSSGYGAFSMGNELERVLRYISNQG